jgi:tRNA (Thr-GGU) A37 N-methylase
MSYQVSPVGFVRSCFKEKFAIPRQPQLAPAARGVLELVAPFDGGDEIRKKAEQIDVNQCISKRYKSRGKE